MEDYKIFTELQIPEWILNTYPELFEWLDYTKNKPIYFTNINPLKFSKWAVSAWCSDKIVFQSKIMWDDEYMIQLQDKNWLTKVFVINKKTLEFKELPEEEWIKFFAWENKSPVDLQNAINQIKEKGDDNVLTRSIATDEN